MHLNPHPRPPPPVYTPVNTRIRRITWSQRYQHHPQIGAFCPAFLPGQTKAGQPLPMACEQHGQQQRVNHQ
jgi:hypothetical protein